MNVTTNVTTASAIEGWRIDRHLGVVASHIIAGTGFFSDFFASFTDVVGGRSETYRKQIAGLYDEAMGQLVDETQRRGGNWVVGIRIDMDEISGKGKQMFMVSATGTAVFARRSVIDGLHALEQLDRTVSKDDVSVMVRRRQLIAQAQEGSLRLDGRVMEFLIQNQVVEVATTILKAFPTYYETSTQGPIDAGRVLEYFGALPTPAVSKILYEALTGDCATAALAIIRHHSLTDLRYVLEGLASRDLAVKRRVLQTIGKLQRTYSKESLDIVDELMQRIPAAFSYQAPTRQKSTLLGKTKTQRQCECGSWVDIDEQLCGCGKDELGFVAAEITPAKAITLLTTHRGAIRELFGIAEPRSAANLT